MESTKNESASQESGCKNPGCDHEKMIHDSCGGCHAKPSADLDEAKKNAQEPNLRWESEKADLIDTLKRVAADFDNYKKRIAKQIPGLELNASADLISQLLPVVDSFEMCLSLDKDSDESARKGRELVFASLMDILEKKGLRSIDALGKPFDPHLHEALMSAKGNETDKNKVIEVLQKGYTINGQVIRTAKVKVVI